MRAVLRRGDRQRRARSWACEGYGLEAGCDAELRAAAGARSRSRRSACARRGCRSGGAAGVSPRRPPPPLRSGSRAVPPRRRSCPDVILRRASCRLLDERKSTKHAKTQAFKPFDTSDTVVTRFRPDGRGKPELRTAVFFRLLSSGPMKLARSRPAFIRRLTAGAALSAAILVLTACGGGGDAVSRTSEPTAAKSMRALEPVPTTSGRRSPTRANASPCRERRPCDTAAAAPGSRCRSTAAANAAMARSVAIPCTGLSRSARPNRAATAAGP